MQPDALAVEGPVKPMGSPTSLALLAPAAGARPLDAGEVARLAFGLERARSVRVVALTIEPGERADRRWSIHLEHDRRR